MGINAQVRFPALAGDPAWDRYRQAVERTHALINPQHHRSTTRGETRRRALDRMNRVRALLQALDNPQNAYPIVHVAGTSGKGSTATAIASILTTAGYRTGLHTSPYLQAATEKIQIDGELMDADEFAGLVDFILERAATVPAFQDASITYGEAWVAMTLHWFAGQGVDAVVLETGAGGRFDLTNVVEPVASVITSIGLDHMETLGSTIADIAWHKAGIIKPGAPVITAAEDPEALAVITREAALQGTRLVQASSPAPAAGDGVTFHQANMALAAAAVAELAPSALSVTEDQVQTGIARMRIPGRIERVQESPLVLLDGAHNPQKIGALAASLERLAPVGSGGMRTIISGALDSKNHGEMLAALIPYASRFVFTTPRVVGKQGYPPGDLVEQVRVLGFRGETLVVSQPLEALELALAQSGPDDAIVVTGSMYLAGNIREYWYSTLDMVLQRTSWPERRMEHLPKQ
jgi:dihydrofolate synthase/folylpolyglutamate synthase